MDEHKLINSCWFLKKSTNVFDVIHRFKKKVYMFYVNETPKMFKCFSNIKTTFKHVLNIGEEMYSAKKVCAHFYL